MKILIIISYLIFSYNSNDCIERKLKDLSKNEVVIILENNLHSKDLKSIYNPFNKTLLYCGDIDRPFLIIKDNIVLFESFEILETVNYFFLIHR